MHIILELDARDYEAGMPVTVRHAVRGLISRADGLWLMQIASDGMFKLPGGGVEANETHEDTLRRELLEETGTMLVEGSMHPVGEIVERRRDVYDHGRIFEQHSYYYVCQIEDTGLPLALSESELAWGLAPVWRSLDEVLEANMQHSGEYWLFRDTAFIRWLLSHPEVITEGEKA